MIQSPVLYAHVSITTGDGKVIDNYKHAPFIGLPIKWSTFQPSTTKDVVVNSVEEGFNGCHRNSFAHATAFAHRDHWKLVARVLTQNSQALYKSAS